MGRETGVWEDTMRHLGGEEDNWERGEMNMGYEERERRHLAL